jgi:hypothetical protein
VFLGSGEKGIDLRLVIYPYHLLLMLQLQDAGFWPLFEEWKADVATLSDDARRRGVHVSLWDFGCPNELTAEAVPPEGERGAAMQWYWEAGHFKKELGDLVLARVLGAGDSNGADGFGLELTTANVGERNKACRAALAAMRRSSRLLDARSASPVRKRIEANGSLK